MQMKMSNIFWAKTDKHQKVIYELADKEDLEKCMISPVQRSYYHIKTQLISHDLWIITTET